MNWKKALIRGVRTFFQGFAGTLVGIPTLDAFTKGAVLAQVALIGAAAWVGFVTGLISFAQNIAEDATDAPIPKG